MTRLGRAWSAVAVLVGFSFYFALSSWGSGASANLVAGWNLLGNGSSAPLIVAETFGNSSQVTTVWKWVSVKGNWAFYTPLQSDGGAAYATSKGYDFLSTVAAGEGFWVNAKTSFTASLPAGTSLTSASFRAKLAAGWNLVASGDNPTPSQFNIALNTAPPPSGTTPINLITLWSWDASLANWNFYAPSLEASGGTALSDYVANKGYLNFSTKTLDQATGFWVNRSAPPAAITLSSSGASSAMPLSILTLTGTGFDPTATTIVRFFDGNQYSVGVQPVRVSSTSIAVTVPPYFNTTPTVFAPGMVGVTVTQSSGAGVRTSAALSGLQILDLPTPSAAAGSITLNFLQGLQIQATTLQSSITGTALDSAELRSSLASQASSLGPIITAVQSVVLDATKRVSLGTVNGAIISMGAAELGQTDRLILGVLLVLASPSTAIVDSGGAATANIANRPARPSAPEPKRAASMSAGKPVLLALNGSLDRLAIGTMFDGLLSATQALAGHDTLGDQAIRLAQVSSSGIPMQAEADAYTKCLLSSDVASCSALPTLRAPQASVPGRLPAATNTALSVVGASLVGAVAIAALLGTPVAATAGVLALGGYLAYATVFTGLAQMGIGGSLGQTSADARQLVEGGLKQLNDFVRDTTISIGVSTVAGDTAGIINDAVTAAKNLRDALDQTIFPATATTATPTTSTTTTTTTTTTLATAYCACIFDVYSTAFGPGGAWICKNTNTWYSSGGYLMSYGQCSCDPSLYQVCQ